MTEKVSNILYGSFEQMWFDFPTPFKRGDIAWIPPHYRQVTTDNYGGFFVVCIRFNEGNSGLHGYEKQQLVFQRSI